MKFSRRDFLGGVAAFAAGPRLMALEVPPGMAGIYETADGLATDSVLVRRLFLDLAGRLPTAEEARAYTEDPSPEKKRRLVDRLLAEESFADYWSMRFCDILRVKSEFPINLWPNAVYVYHRRIRAFVLKDEPWPDFARALLLATGSDFRDPEANFYRATARRTPEGYAETALQTFLGDDWRKLPGVEAAAVAECFSGVRIKHTREWKEEIVEIDGPDRRGEFYDRLTGVWREAFAAALVQRVGWWLLARREADPEDVAAFRSAGWRLKAIVRRLVLSGAYARGPVKGGFPCRRLDAEVLDDAFCDLTGTGRGFQSIAPEPFTFLPPDRRTVLVEDGSISTAFLTLFGRPARDSGLLSERDNTITAKQRLYLFNSGRLYDRLGKMITEDRAMKRAGAMRRFDRLYWRFLSREPSRLERDRLAARFERLPKGRERWEFTRDVAWALINTREFLYQH